MPITEIAAVADVYSALAPDRPYGRALESREIISLMRQMAGSHLNREIVHSFLSILPAYPVGSRVEFGSGKLQGYHGQVGDNSSDAIDRPIVRVLFDAHSIPINPFEVDTGNDAELKIISPPHDFLRLKQVF